MGERPLRKTKNCSPRPKPEHWYKIVQEEKDCILGKYRVWELFLILFEIFMTNFCFYCITVLMFHWRWVDDPTWNVWKNKKFILVKNIPEIFIHQRCLQTKEEMASNSISIITMGVQQPTKHQCFKNSESKEQEHPTTEYFSPDAETINLCHKDWKWKLQCNFKMTVFQLKQ